ncbi:MAG: serine/threonine protein phosphatase [Phycisphaerales bacterium]|nr:serine/threonine protein phosphatase [Phycisphaerales bacterium]
MSAPSLPAKPSRTLIVGDIHGHVRALDALLHAASPGLGDRLVFLGDYVNGGPSSAQVLDRLIRLQRAHGAVCLRGNHDDLFERVLDSPSGMDAFMALGGAVTLASYDGPHARTVPKSHRAFLGGLPLAWHDERVICIHGQIDPHADPGDPDHVKALWGSVVHAESHASGRTVICGHVSQRSGVPLDLGHTVCIDTAIRHGGWLTMLDAVGWTYIKANAQGDVRTGRLRG